MKNNEVVRQIRYMLFNLLKECVELEEKYYVNNPSDIDKRAFDYLTEVQKLIRKYDFLTEDIYRTSMEKKFNKE